MAWSGEQIQRASSNPGTFAYNLKEALVANGWTVESSSDGTTYNSTDDEWDNGTDANNAGAWTRISHPEQGEITIQLNTGGGATLNQWRIKRTPTQFDGGSPDATTTPSSTEEQILWGGGTDAAPTFSAFCDLNTGSEYSIIVETASPYRFWAMENDTAAGTLLTQLTYDYALDTEQDDPWVMRVWHNSFGTAWDEGTMRHNSTPALFGRFDHGLASAAWEEMTLGILALNAQRVYPGSNGGTGVDTTYQDADGSWRIFHGVYIRPGDQTSPNGYFGISSMIGWVPSRLAGEGWQDHQLLDLDGNDKSAVVLNDMILPWPTGQAYTQSPGADVVCKTAGVGTIVNLDPKISAVSPSATEVSPGTLGANFAAGSKQAITLTLDRVNSRPVIVWMRYTNANIPLIIYDEDNGFAPMFAQASTRVGDVFTIVPTGGWIDGIAELRGAVFAEALTA